jgi:hypothetical protein
MTYGLDLRMRSVGRLIKLASQRNETKITDEIYRQVAEG